MAADYAMLHVLRDSLSAAVLWLGVAAAVVHK
jgi:hypothetical protein